MMLLRMLVLSLLGVIAVCATSCHLCDTQKEVTARPCTGFVPTLCQCAAGFAGLASSASHSGDCQALSHFDVIMRVHSDASTSEDNIRTSTAQATGVGPDHVLVKSNGGDSVYDVSIRPLPPSRAQSIALLEQIKSLLREGQLYGESTLLSSPQLRIQSLSYLATVLRDLKTNGKDTKMRMEQNESETLEVISKLVARTADGNQYRNSELQKELGQTVNVALPQLRTALQLAHSHADRVADRGQADVDSVRVQVSQAKERLAALAQRLDTSIASAQAVSAQFHNDPSAKELGRLLAQSTHQISDLISIENEFIRQLEQRQSEVVHVTERNNKRASQAVTLAEQRIAIAEGRISVLTAALRTENTSGGHDKAVHAGLETYAHIVRKALSGVVGSIDKALDSIGFALHFLAMVEKQLAVESAKHENQ